MHVSRQRWWRRGRCADLPAITPAGTGCRSLGHISPAQLNEFYEIGFDGIELGGFSQRFLLMLSTATKWGRPGRRFAAGAHPDAADNGFESPPCAAAARCFARNEGWRRIASIRATSRR